jgi:hypothetical protein
MNLIPQVIATSSNMLIKCQSILSISLLNLVMLANAAIPVLSESRQTFQSLPNGVYFYGESQMPNQQDTYYFVLQKTGNGIVGMSYTGMERTECFRGTSSDNSINNLTVAEVEPNSTVGWQFSQAENPINLHELHRINSDKIPEGALGQLQECVRLFSNRR